MTDTPVDQIKEALPNGGASLCSKCNSRERRCNSSWCPSCLNEYAAQYRERTRRTIEERTTVCALDKCSQTFMWKSSHPGQKYCSKRCMETARRRRNRHQILEGLGCSEGELYCGRCNLNKSSDEFAPSNRQSGRYCRDCNQAYKKEWDAKNRDRRSASTRKARAKKKLVEYKAPSDDFDALLVEQGGACAICKGDNNGKSFHIDHDHVTNLYRGLLCNGCNAGLGHFKDNRDLLFEAAYYLKKPLLTTDVIPTGADRIGHLSI